MLDPELVENIEPFNWYNTFLTPGTGTNNLPGNNSFDPLYDEK